MLCCYAAYGPWMIHTVAPKLFFSEIYSQAEDLPIAQTAFIVPQTFCSTPMPNTSKFQT